MDTIDITITLTSGAGDTCRGCGYIYVENVGVADLSKM